ncbi:hypothetical protein [Burkholderia diffusa]|uniref:hypothetical protein n=1 Tax=Burkholderia diffusa TaxID=488732 RepID=UPI000841DA86|nr:hypothetical protein [Burkholderia diffusa]AOI60898.1 hypothetical protein WI26_25535 [Burkholderia diffusa]
MPVSEKIGIDIARRIQSTALDRCDKWHLVKGSDRDQREEELACRVMEQSALVREKAMRRYKETRKKRQPRMQL